MVTPYNEMTENGMTNNLLYQKKVLVFVVM